MTYGYRSEDQRGACWQCSKRYPACQDHCPDRKKEIEVENIIKEKRIAYNKLVGDLIAHSNYAHRRIMSGK